MTNTRDQAFWQLQRVFTYLAARYPIVQGNVWSDALKIVVTAQDSALDDWRMNEQVTR